ncbi:uncharacterized protein LOC129908459 [Episyrphus balteatus]|uniref:uncharacterized protein LOC129908459 n=1 Tax=Episyrphus balteatus TaxID=286459 RepID=UPI00248536EA|nr:uncharacterized protein LOC129908459 [Episyrphus balteatus]
MEKATKLQLTEEEENLLLDPFANLDMEDGASAIDVDDSASMISSVASSNFSNSSRRSRISTCKRTIRRLGKLDWGQMSEEDRMRLHNARAFMDREGLGKARLSPNPPSSKAPSIKTVMGPPAPLVSKQGNGDIPSTSGAIASTADEQSSGRERTDLVVRTHVVASDSSSAKKVVSSGGASVKADGKGTNVEGTDKMGCKDNLVGHSPQVTQNTTIKSVTEGTGLMGCKDNLVGRSPQVTQITTIKSVTEGTGKMGCKDNLVGRSPQVTQNITIKSVNVNRSLSSAKSVLPPGGTTGKVGELDNTVEGKGKVGCEANLVGRSPQDNRNTTTEPDPANQSINSTFQSLATVIHKKTRARALDENEIRRRQNRNAERIVRHFAKRSPESLTAKERVALDKSHQRLRAAAEQGTAGTPSTSKRARNDANSPTSSSPNKTKKKRRTSQVSVKGHHVAIADYGKPSRKLTEDEWHLLELRILEQVNEAIVKSWTVPLFGNLKTVHGFKVMHCENDMTLEWLREFIQKTSAPWQGAELRLIDVKEIKDLNRPLGRLLVKGPTLPNERLERYILSLNSDLLSREWEVVKNERTDDGTEVVVRLSHKSLPLLRKADFKIRVGITRCKLRLIRNDRKQ